MFDERTDDLGTDPEMNPEHSAGAVVIDDETWALLQSSHDMACELNALLEAASATLAALEPVEGARLGSVASDLADAAQRDLSTATDDELCALALEVEAARRHLDATALHALAELDARGVTDSQEGLVTGSWLANEAQLPTAATRARVKLAMKLRVSLPDVDTALSEGRITLEHARVLADAANPRILDDFALVVTNLIDAASRLGFDQWKREVVALADLLDADGGHRPGDDITDNTLRLRHGLGGTVHLEGQLCGDLALIANEALEAKADELFRRFRGDQELTPGLRMPPRSTLLALAAVELWSQGLAKEPGSSTPARPEVSLIVNAADPSTVSTGDGVRIGDTERHTLLCDPVFRVVVLGLHGIVTDMGREQRLVTREQRRALNQRDGGCVFPGCDRPASWTDAHHVWHWLHGGPTDLSLLASLCRYHHGVSHRNNWKMYATADEWFWWTAPSGHTFWSQRHGHQRQGPTPDPATCTNATGPPQTGRGHDEAGESHGTGPPDTT